MNLNEVIHTRWAADATLNGLLASTKFQTGIHFASDDEDPPREPEFPYATLTRPGDTPEGWANDGSGLLDALVRITVYHDAPNYDEGLAIADAVKSCFNRTDFSLSGSDEVLNMQLAGYQEIQDTDEANYGAWFFVLDFNCQVYLAAGV